jgi:hypothetical protein
MLLYKAALNIINKKAINKQSLAIYYIKAIILY